MFQRDRALSVRSPDGAVSPIVAHRFRPRLLRVHVDRLDYPPWRRARPSAASGLGRTTNELTSHLLLPPHAFLTPATPLGIPISHCVAFSLSPARTIYASSSPRISRPHPTPAFFAAPSHLPVSARLSSGPLSFGDFGVPNAPLAVLHALLCHVPGPAHPVILSVYDIDRLCISSVIVHHEARN